MHNFVVQNDGTLSSKNNNGNKVELAYRKKQNKTPLRATLNSGNSSPVNMQPKVDPVNYK